ncbi:MAG: hypothetical protein QF662_05905, partial [Phycisphaerae bacterium]|nr:hypothetical protein [Phycisphaerae bacterium]
LNIMINEEAIKKAKGVEDISEVFASPVQLEGVTVERVLELALPPDVSFDVRSDLILITTRERLQKNLPARTYAVRDLIASIPEFGGQAPSFDITSVIETGPGTGGGGGAVGGFFDEAGGGIEDEEVLGVDALKELIMRTVNPRSDQSVAEWLDNGGTGTIEDIRGVLVITQTERGHQLIKELLDQLRAQRAVMVSVETRFVTVSDDFLQDITLDVDLAFQGGRRFNQAGNPIGDPGAATSYTTLPGLATGQFGQPIVISSTSSNGAGTSSMLPLTSFGFTGNEGGIAIGGVFLDKIQLGFMLRAIQADKRSTVMWAPRITMYDGQRAYVSVTTQNLYVSDLEPVVSTGGGDGDASALYNPTISAIPEGTTLDVRATVSADRKYVQLDLYPQVVGIAGWEDFGLGVEGTLPISLPQVSNQEIRTTVSVPDGGTLLLGGLKKFTEIDVEAGAPILNKIPILKRLFNNRASLSSQSNLLILITPRIIIQAEEEHEQTGL